MTSSGRHPTLSAALEDFAARKDRDTYAEKNRLLQAALLRMIKAYANTDQLPLAEQEAELFGAWLQACTLLEIRS